MASWVLGVQFKFLYGSVHVQGKGTFVVDHAQGCAQGSQFKCCETGKQEGSRETEFPFSSSLSVLGGHAANLPQRYSHVSGLWTGAANDVLVGPLSVSPSLGLTYLFKAAPCRYLIWEDIKEQGSELFNQAMNCSQLTAKTTKFHSFGSRRR